MFLKNYLLVFAAIFACAYKAKGACVLPRQYVLNHANYLFTASMAGHRRLLLNQNVPEGATLHITCQQVPVAELFCNPDRTFNGLLPDVACNVAPLMVIVSENLAANNLNANVRGFIAAQEIQPGRPGVTVRDGVKLVSRQQRPLTADTNGRLPPTLFRVGFEDNIGFLDLYRSLFDNNRLLPVLTVHKHRNFGADPRTERPRFWKMDGINAERDYVFSYFKNTYMTALNRAVNGNEWTRQHINPQTESIIDRGHLTPNGDFLFNSHRHATFHLFNAAPQFNRINNCDWNDIEVFIYRNYNAEVTVITGTTGNGISLHGRPFFLYTNRLPIPSWIYKVVLDNAGHVRVFISYNNIFEQNLNARLERGQFCPVYTAPAAPPAPPCRQVACPQNLQRRGDGRFTYCCDPADFRINNPVLQRFY